jgi:RimJ/RimL family protein N-acetyltransferase
MTASGLPPAKIRLEPMSDADFAVFFERSIADYAEDNVRAGRWDPANAREASRADHDRLLPQGMRTPDHYLRAIRDAGTGGRVGDVWYAVRSEGGPPGIWIFWLGVDPAHRRHGYAAAALAAVEEEARRLGVLRIGLHVFAFNAGARALYERLGYETTNLVMWKSVPP